MSESYPQMGFLQSMHGNQYVLSVKICVILQLKRNIRALLYRLYALLISIMYEHPIKITFPNRWGQEIPYAGMHIVVTLLTS